MPTDPTPDPVMLDRDDVTVEMISPALCLACAMETADRLRESLPEANHAND